MCLCNMLVCMHCPLKWAEHHGGKSNFYCYKVKNNTRNFSQRWLRAKLSGLSLRKSFEYLLLPLSTISAPVLSNLAKDLFLQSFLSKIIHRSHIGCTER